MAEKKLTGELRKQLCVQEERIKVRTDSMIQLPLNHQASVLLDQNELLTADLKVAIKLRDTAENSCRKLNMKLLAEKRLTGQLKNQLAVQQQKEMIQLPLNHQDNVELRKIVQKQQTEMSKAYKVLKEQAKILDLTTAFCNHIIEEAKSI